MSNEPSDHSRALLQELVKNSSHRAQIAGLKGGDAQCIANLLSVLLHEDGAFGSEEGRRLFRLLRRLVKSSKVLPQCYKLQGLQCDFSQAREGGSFADIFEGEYRKQKVCVKAVRIFEKDDNAKMLQAIAKEAVLWAHLFHGNILPFYGVYIPKKSGRICIISPWMSRGDLSTHLRNTPDAPRLPLILDVIAGLRYLHASSIVHGDLKAKNVLISDKGRALIADFGISYLPVSANSVSTRLSNGSMRWMAPELLVEECPPTLYSDVWSFGCVCFEVFTCKVPFYDYANDVQIFSALVKRTRRPGDANEPNHASIKERELMDQCWNYEPDSRPSCEEIYKSVVDLVGERESAKLEDVAIWNAVRVGSGGTINHVHAHRILLWIRGTHEYPHDSPLSDSHLSIHPIPTKPGPGLNFSYSSANPPGGSSPPSGPRLALPASDRHSDGYDSYPNPPHPTDERRPFTRFLSFLTPKLPRFLQSHVPDFTEQQQQQQPRQSPTRQLRSSGGHVSPRAIMYHTNRLPPRPLAKVQNYKPQMQGPNPTVPTYIHYPQDTGRKKALCMGISYFGQADELKGCVNDAHDIRRFLCDFFHYRPEDVVILTDDNPQSRHRPTKENIIQAMQWLVRSARSNDTLFFHYSGRGGQIEGRDGDGTHGGAQAIYPTDFRQSGHIVDDLMHDIMVKPLPVGCRLTSIFDSCSGLGLGLPYIYYGGSKTVEVDKYTQVTKSSPADVISWSVCTNLQTGANTPGVVQATGAMSSAFMAALREKRNQSYQELLNNTCDILQGQKPQLSSSHLMDTSTMFTC